MRFLGLSFKLNFWLDLQLCHSFPNLSFEPLFIRIFVEIKKAFHENEVCYLNFRCLEGVKETDVLTRDQCGFDRFYLIGSDKISH